MSKNGIRRPLLAISGFSIYELLTFLNLFSYVKQSALGLSGENYEGFIAHQVWINPFVRILDELSGIPSRPLEELALFSLFEVSSQKAFAYFLYSVVEIFALDFFLGGVFWLGLFYLAPGIYLRIFDR